MQYPLSLRQKIYLPLACMAAVMFASGGIVLWYVTQMDGMVSSLVNRDIKAFKAIQEMQVALSNQKGYLSYYFIDGQPQWLQELGIYRQRFQQNLREAMDVARNEQQLQILKDIQARYQDYVSLKDKAIQNYREQDRRTISEAHLSQRDQFFDILKMCESYQELQWDRIAASRQDSQAKADTLLLIVVFAILSFLLLFGFMIMVLSRHVLDPLRHLVEQTGGDATMSQHNEVQSLTTSVKKFKEDFDSTTAELCKNRAHLEQAEKMVLVGKLAAGVAHTIRNPFTSVKMRLFSLSRTLDMNQAEQEDFQVISDEIKRIDTIVQNFLEFARPPKLKVRECALHDVVEAAIQLLRHRLQACNVTITHTADNHLPQILADPEQLKEALINLIMNASEAMGSGGEIVISESLGKASDSGRYVQVQVQDNGPGIPEAIQDRVLEPFFTTKEEGTGLGLSIVVRIIEEHQGEFGFRSQAGQGTEFRILLPLQGAGNGHHPDH